MLLEIGPALADPTATQQFKNPGLAVADRITEPSLAAQLGFRGARARRSLRRVEDRARPLASQFRQCGLAVAVQFRCDDGAIGTKQSPFRAGAVLKEGITVQVALDEIAVSGQRPMFEHRNV